MANATSTQLQELYVAYFGRAADPTGLDYWTSAGTTTATFAASMYAQAEFNDVYGGLSTESQVNQIYQNLFDRDADVTGLLYWTKEINDGNIQIAEIANHLIWAAQNNSGSEDDKTALQNKTNAAIAYTNKVKETTAGILAYQAETTVPWKAGVNITEAVSFLSDINKDTEATTASIAASVATITGNGVPSLIKNYELTAGIDDIDGTAGTNKIQAGLTSSGGNTLNSLDEIDGGNGTDTLNATIATSVTPGEIKNVENINLTFDVTTKTFNATNVTGVTTLTDIGSSFLGITSNLGTTSTKLKVSDNSVGATFTYQASAVTGTADSVDLTLSNATGGNAVITTITGAVETLNLTSSTSANTLRLNSAATTLNISGDQDLTLGADSTTLDNTTTIDATNFTGALTFAHDHASAAVTITGGSGNDAITLTGTAQTVDTVSGGAGNDTLTFTHASDLTDADVIDGGEGTADTLVGDDGELVALTTANNISNIEVIESASSLASGTLTTANIDSDIKSVTLAAGANAGTVTFGAGTNTLTLGTASGGALTVNDTGLATDDVLNINMSSAADSTNDKNLTIGGFETVNIDTGTATAKTIGAIAITGDPDSAGTRTAVTLTLTGAAQITTSGATTLGAATGAGTINASAMTAGLIMGVAADGTTTITGGSGNDTLLGDGQASTLTGGAGDDAITGGAASDIISGGTGNDTFTGTAGGTGVNDTITGGEGNDIFVFTDANLVAGHVLGGGEGTDTLRLDDLSAVTDGQLENNTSIEVLTSDATGLSATLDVYAQAMGLTTVTLVGTIQAGVADTVTIQNDVTNAITVNVDDLNDDGIGAGDDSNTVDASAYTGTLTIVTESAAAIRGTAGGAIAGEIAYTGGTGTSDTLSFHGGTFTITQLTGITAIENWTQSDDVTSSLTIDELNIADGKTLTVDVRSIIDSSKTATINLVDDSNGVSVVHGGVGADTITGSSSDLGDTINGYAGADSIRFVAAQLTTLDTVDGGAGTDTLNIITTAATLADADFTNVSNIEALTFGVASSDTDLGAEYSASGSSTITLTTGTNDLNLDSVTTAQTLNLVAGTDTIDASSMTAALTVDYAASAGLTNADTITGGTSTSDVLEVTFDTTAAAFDGVTAIETFKSGADTASQSFTTVDANVASTESLTIDMSSQATNGYTVDISAETNGAISITGGAAAGTITLSSSSLGDTFTGGAGADGVTVIGAQLTSADILNGGAGTDTLTIGTVGTLSDSDFTNVSNFEALVGGDGAITMVLGSEFSGAGFTTHTEFDNGDTAAVNITYGSGVSTAQTYAVKTSSTTLSATGMTSALTLTAIEADITSADTFTGGSGSDTLSMTFSGTAASAGDIGSITSIETYKSATNHVGGFTFNDANFVSNNFSVDATANTTAAFTVDASAEDDSTMTYTGGAGIDTVTGTATTATGDTITAGAGADIITGAGGGDTITGGAGADVFTYTAVAHSTGTARDTISDFTSGTDKFAFTLDQSSQTNAVTIDATIQTARAGTSAVQANLSGSIGQTIYDTTNSRLIVNANSDNLVTTLDYQVDVNAATTAASTIADGDVQYTITTGSAADTVTSGGGDDTITTAGGADIITSGGGADSITSGAAADTITSGAGIDTIVAGTGNDIITAGAGADIITGGTGDDTIASGTGADVINVAYGGEGTDYVTDFSAGTGGDIWTFTGTTDVNDASGTDITVAGFEVYATDANYALTKGITVFDNGELGDATSASTYITTTEIATELTGFATSRDATVATAGDVAYVVVGDGTYSTIAKVTGGTDTVIDAGNITIIAHLTVADTGTFVAGNFGGFS